MTENPFVVPDSNSPSGGLPPSALAEQLVTSGAYANETDVNALMTQMEEMTARLAQLEKERGVPSNPIEGALADLKTHTKVLSNMWPWHDFSAVLSHLETLPSHDQLTRDHTELTRAVVSGFTRVSKHIENSDYLEQLANDLHIHVLKSLTKVV